MAAIARRTLLALLATGTADDLRDVLASMATDLSAGNLTAFMRATASDMPGREELRQQLSGLLAAFDLSCSIQVQTATGDDNHQTAKVDWYLSGRSTNDNAVTIQRREVLTIEFARVNKRWRVAKLDPLTFFSPSN